MNSFQFAIFAHSLEDPKAKPLFLAVRYDFVAAGRCCEDFMQRWQNFLLLVQEEPYGYHTPSGKTKAGVKDSPSGQHQ